MFSGIIEAIGTLQEVAAVGGDKRLQIGIGKLDMADVKLGDSIACNGVCLTVVDFDSQSFSADVSRETLQCTTIDDYRVGQMLNLEKALLPTTRLGGHMVSGHVDGVGEVRRITADARSTRYRFWMPPELAKFVAAKGSICVDGTSLTVNQVDSGHFDVNLVPHTIEETIASTYVEGTRVNLEIDVVARYLERMLAAGGELPTNQES